MSTANVEVEKNPFRPLFSDEDVKVQLLGAQRTLKHFQLTIQSEIEKSKIENLLNVLNIFFENSELIDRNTQVNISLISHPIRRELDSLSAEPTLEKIDELYCAIFRFVLEFDLSISGSLSSELRSFIDFADEKFSNFSERQQAQIKYARTGMPITILKALLNDSTLGRIKDTKEYSAAVDAKLSEWEETIKKKQAAVDALKSNLDKYESAYNFVGLYDAFKILSAEKTKQLFWLKTFTIIFGALALAPVLAGAAFAHSSLFKETLFGYISTAIPVFSVTLILIYYFRILLRSVDSCRSQILQLELRKALCQFIQSYATYAKTMRKDDASLLDKFESVVFSGIVASDEKMPSTFDGVDQLANLFKAVRSK